MARERFRFRSLEEWNRLPDAQKDAHERSIRAKRDMVELGYSRQEVLDLYHLDSRTFMRHVGVGMERRGRRWVAKRADRIPAVMSMYAKDSETKVQIVTRTAKERRDLGEHTQLVQSYRRLYIEGAPPGKSQAAMEAEIRARLAAFEGRKIGGHGLLTDTAEIEDRIDRDTLEGEGPYPEEL